MDWKIIFSEYPLLIPAISAVIVAILGFIFARINASYNKKLDIEKKQYEKGIEIRSARVKEAREYVSSWEKTVNSLEHISSDLLDVVKNINNKKSSDIVPIQNRLQSIKGTVDDLWYQSHSLRIFGDKNLDQLSDKFCIEIQKVMKLLVPARKEIDGQKIEDWEERISQARSLLVQLHSMVTAIERRLDELALDISKE